ncbi:MAG: sigma-70 family RNA polymerase sigma factor [Planctomycetaceae bacterium]
MLAPAPCPLFDTLVAAHAGLRAGLPEARDAVVSAAAERIRVVARRMLRSFPAVHRWDDTDDVAQNAAMRLPRALATTVPETPEHLVNLVTLQVRRELIDLVRKHRGPLSFATNHDTNAALVGGELRMHAEGMADPAVPSAIDRWAAFHDAVAALPPEERAVFDLAWFAGCDQAAAARQLGCSVRTVKRRWEAAKERLRAACGDRPPDVD